MHKERIFSASSGRHQGTSSGNMKPCPLRRCVVFSCPLLIFPFLRAHFLRFAFTVAAGGGRTERSLFLWNARARARRAERPPFFPGGRPVIGRAPPVSPSPSAFPLSLPRAAFVFSPVRSGPAPCRFFAAPCGAFCRERLPHPCGVLHRGPPAACPGIFLSRLSVVSSPRRFLSLLLRTSAMSSPASLPPSAIRPLIPPLRTRSFAPSPCTSPRCAPSLFPRTRACLSSPPSLSLAPCAPSHPFRVPRYPPGIVFHLPGWPSVPRGGPGA